LISSPAEEVTEVTGWCLVSNHQKEVAKRSAMMTLNRANSRFTSYVDLNSTDDPGDLQLEIKPNLLEGEMMITQADKVCLYSSQFGGSTSGQTGALFVTTLKLSFKNHLTTEESSSQQNKLLSNTDISLSSIEAVFEIHGDNADKRRRLMFGSSIPHRIEGIFVLCKNFKFLKFSFKFSTVDAGRNITNALLHHSRPKKIELLFAFDSQTACPVKARSVPVWEKMMLEADCSHLRLCRANQSWQICPSLPQEFVVPDYLTDEVVARVADTCTGARPPVWVWGNRAGGAVFVQSRLSVSQNSNTDQMFDNYYRKSSREYIDLDISFPKASHLEESFASILELHCNDGEKEVEEKEKNYFSSLESSGWLLTLGCALDLASQVAEHVVRGKTVLLVESDGRATALLISSLAMIILSETFRTRDGLELLIQAVWVSLGFKFSKNHTLSQQTSKQSNPHHLNPVFLIFLDCVHQICHQFPAHLEFSTRYLMTVWDTALLPMFDTFIFDCDHNRYLARSSRETPLDLQSAFDWSQQFSEAQIESWDNPLYGIPLRPDRAVATEPSSSAMMMGRQQKATFPESCRVLPVSGCVANLTVWNELFHRSVSSLPSSNAWSERLLSDRREVKSEIRDIMKTTSSANGQVSGQVRKENNHKK